MDCMTRKEMDWYLVWFNHFWDNRRIIDALGISRSTYYRWTIEALPSERYRPQFQRAYYALAQELEETDLAGKQLADLLRAQILPLPSRDYLSLSKTNKAVEAIEEFLGLNGRSNSRRVKAHLRQQGFSEVAIKNAARKARIAKEVKGVGIHQVSHWRLIDET